jgi:hypothetical protein
MYIDDITIRKILNIKKFDIVNINDNILKNKREKKLNNIVSFYLTNDRNISCIGFIIDTIDGEFTIPVIGMKNIRKKRLIKKELLLYIFQKHKKQKYNILIKYTNLPIEIIDKIMIYY